MSFNGTDGEEPFTESLVQGTDGNFYGTTFYGGIVSTACSGGTTCGTVFNITASGTLNSLYSFCALGNTKGYCPDGRYPAAGLTLAADGSFYGTAGGGPYEDGTIFSVTPGGELNNLHAFNYSNGFFPQGSLLQAADGNFYGTTLQGGAYRSGTVFRVTPTGELTTLYSFCAESNCTDGSAPYSNLVQASNGDIYGITQVGGITSPYCTYGCGTVFRVARGVTQPSMYSFCSQTNCSDGILPSGLLLASNGSLYGTTQLGGASNFGTVFRLTLSGTFETIYSFCQEYNCADGSGPVGSLVQAGDGRFYGATSAGGSHNYGTVFETTTSGKLVTLHSFANSDGASPSGGLLLATTGVFYGTTSNGGDLTCNAPDGCGTIFSLSTGLGPFVAFVQGAGKVGQQAQILGQQLTNTSNVSFNGVSASFKVVSDTYITATVPSRATTGFVTVTTPTGTLTSNVKFNVLP